MYDSDDNQGFAVLFLVLLLVLVFAYCRLPLGVSETGHPHPTNSSPFTEKADTERK